MPGALPDMLPVTVRRGCADGAYESGTAAKLPSWIMPAIVNYTEATSCGADAVILPEAVAA